MILDKGMVGVGKGGGRWGGGRVESSLQGYGRVWVHLGVIGWALAELVCKGVWDCGSVWVGVDGPWLSWFVRVC